MDIDTTVNLPLEKAVRHIRVRRRDRARVMTGLFVGDVFALVTAYATANFIVYGFTDPKQLLTVLSVSIPLLVGFSLHDGAYRPRAGLDARESVYRALKSLMLTSASLMLVAFLLKAGQDFSRAQFLIGTALSAIFLCVVRVAIARLGHGLARRGLFADLHIYDNETIDEKQIGDERFVVDARAMGLIPDLGNSVAINRLGTIAHGMDSVVIHCAPESRKRWANALRALDVPSEIIVSDLDELDALKITLRDGKTAVVLNDGRLRSDQAILKRVFDLVLVLPMIPVLFVAFVIIGICIKLDSPGPVFFRQDRIGIGNRVFRIWKFRSMKVAEQDPTASKLTERNDPRVTRVGAFIRKTSIDELPQLVNVLLGDMSLVGPRPHAAAARAGKLLYWEVDEAYWERHVVKPGITGLAQVRGHRGNTFEEGNLRDRLGADLEYVARWSLVLDAKILVGTIMVPFSKNAF